MKQPEGSICGYSLKAIQKLLANVILSPETGCWHWQGARSQTGYPVMNADGESRYAHRVAYEVFCGEIVGRLVIDHLCRNPLCVNPAHLEPVTLGENNARALRTNPDVCKRGHPLRGANLRVTVFRGNLIRQCKTCRALRHRLEHRAKRLADAAPRSQAVVLLGSIDASAPEIRLRPPNP